MTWVDHHLYSNTSRLSQSKSQRCTAISRRWAPYSVWFRSFKSNLSMRLCIGETKELSTLHAAYLCNLCVKRTGNNHILLTCRGSVQLTHKCDKYFKMPPLLYTQASWHTKLGYQMMPSSEGDPLIDCWLIQELNGLNVLCVAWPAAVDKTLSRQLQIHKMSPWW